MDLRMLILTRLVREQELREWLGLSNSEGPWENPGRWSWKEDGHPQGEEERRAQEEAKSLHTAGEGGDAPMGARTCLLLNA